MWPLLSGGQPQQIAQHDAPVKEIAWISQMNLLVSGSWDKTLRCASLITFSLTFLFGSLMLSNQFRRN
jgi:WD40 repeat protein